MRNLILLIVGGCMLSACGGPPAQNDLPSSRTNSGRSTTDQSKMDHSKMGHSEMTSSPNAASAPYELQFIDTMIAHHQGAVDMAQLAPTRAGHQELKNLAANIVSDQQREIAQMRSWREQHFKGAPPAKNMDLPGMSEGMAMMDMGKLDQLKENPFDLEFIRQMIPHHEGAVLMAKDVLARPESGNAELSRSIRSFAQQIVDAQTGEIAQMKQWLEGWGG